MLEYPKMLFKEGSDLVWEGRQLATKIIEDAEAEAKAVEDGWRTIETLLKGEVEKVVAKVKGAAK